MLKTLQKALKYDTLNKGCIIMSGYYADKLNISFEEMPNVVYASYRAFLPKEKHITRVSSEHVLLMVFKGSLHFTENGVDTVVKEGEYYVQKAGLKQSALRPSDCPEYFYVHFTGEVSKTAKGLQCRGTFNPSEFMVLFDKLHRIHKLPRVSPLERNALFYEVLVKLAHGNEGFCGNVFAKQISELILANYLKNITVEDIAKKLFSSKNRVIEVFKREYGVTPHKYITKLKLEQAKWLLTTTEKKADLIGEESGFSDYSLFYKAFVKEEGCSPIEWRKQYLQND